MASMVGRLASLDLRHLPILPGLAMGRVRRHVKEPEVLYLLIPAHHRSGVARRRLYPSGAAPLAPILNSSPSITAWASEFPMLIGTCAESLLFIVALVLGRKPKNTVMLAIWMP
jgi:hypothetical protein